jgi:hypothetical protein
VHLALKDALPVRKHVVFEPIRNLLTLKTFTEA